MPLFMRTVIPLLRGQASDPEYIHSVLTADVATVRSRSALTEHLVHGI